MCGYYLLLLTDRLQSGIIAVFFDWLAWCHRTVQNEVGGRVPRSRKTRQKEPKEGYHEDFCDVANGNTEGR